MLIININNQYIFVIYIIVIFIHIYHYDLILHLKLNKFNLDKIRIINFIQLVYNIIINGL